VDEPSQGRTDHRAGVFPDDLSDSKLAITGGTGADRNAPGFMTLHSRDEIGPAFDFTFHVIG